jgi:hypothetical protein
MLSLIHCAILARVNRNAWLAHPTLRDSYSAISRRSVRHAHALILLVMIVIAPCCRSSIIGLVNDALIYEANLAFAAVRNANG